MPKHMNGAGTIFGGQLLSWIDEIAGVVAMRHAENSVVTASIDRMDFKTGASEEDVLLLDGRVSWVGHTSMEIRIDTYRIHRREPKSLINTAFLVMVAIDKQTKRPAEVPGLILETEEEQKEFEAGEKRAEIRKYRRKHDI